MRQKPGTALHAATALTAAVCASALLFVAWDWRSPMSPVWRYWLFGGLLSGTLLTTSVGWLLTRGQGEWIRWAGRGVVLVSLSAAVVLLSLEGRFHWVRYQVLSADPQELAVIGDHIIVGYTDLGPVQTLIGRGAVGGVFITARNVREKSIEAVAAEVADLKRRRVPLQPAGPGLWVAADQEGGIVSKLSPPLTRLPPLSEVILPFAEPTQRASAVREYARTHAAELKQIGVNLNLAPVVDVNYDLVSPGDKYTRIYRRAIAADPGRVWEVANIYCTELKRSGIQCTAKHFPGLGRVTNDTHLESAELSTPVNELEGSDWLPFRELARVPGAALMVAHAKLTAVDPVNPVSLSEPVISGILRGRWGFDGVLVTDDFSMEALFRAEGGMGEAAVKAINAGVDLILVGFDPDQSYPVILGLLEAKREGRLDTRRLAASRARLLQLQRSMAARTEALPATR